MTPVLGAPSPRNATDRFVAALAIAQAVVVSGAFLLIGPIFLVGAFHGGLRSLLPMLGVLGGTIATLVGALRRGRGPALILLGAAAQILGLLLLGLTGQAWWPLVVPGLAAPVLLLAAAPLAHTRTPSSTRDGRPDPTSRGTA